MNRERQLKCIDRLIRIQERRAALNGLDAPKKLEASGPNGGPLPVEQPNPFNLGLLSVPQLEQLRSLVAAASAQNGQSPKVG